MCKTPVRLSTVNIIPTTPMPRKVQAVDMFSFNESSAFVYTYVFLAISTLLAFSIVSL